MYVCINMYVEICVYRGMQYLYGDMFIYKGILKFRVVLHEVLPHLSMQFYYLQVVGC